MIGLIPARRGSKRVPGKALKEVKGKPLIWYTLQAAELSNLKKYYFTSDYDPEELGDLSMFKKLELIKRPDELCKDGSPANAYIDHLLEVRDYQASIDFRSICLLQPTCPLRNYIDINNAIEIYKRGSLPGLVSAFRVAKGLMYKDNLTSLYGTEFDRNDILYVRNSSIYIFDLQYYIVNASIFASPSHIYEMDMFKSLDINTMADLNVCQKLL